MARPSTIRVLALSAAVALVVPSFAYAQAAPAASPAAAAAPTALPAADVQPFVAQIIGDDVMIRCGPSEAFYATQKLNKGDRVTVVAIRGEKGDWLKIVPPDGSFCYVAKQYVDTLGGSETAGTVRKPELNVRAGSLLNGSKKIVVAMLNKGDAVQILGSQDDYFKIVPPPGAFLYVQRSLVSAVPQATPTAVPLEAKANERDPIASDPMPVHAALAMPGTVTPPAGVVVAPPSAAAVATPSGGGVVLPVGSSANAVEMPVFAAGPATQPTAESAAASVGIGGPATTQPASPIAAALLGKPASPSTRPAVVVAPRQRFDMTEAEFTRAGSMPLDKQPLEGLRWRYKTLAANDGLPASLRQQATARIRTLDLRITARDEGRAVAASAAAAADRLKALEAERQELSQRVKDQKVETFAALGTLRISSLQQTGTTLYRLADPNTGSTLVYLRSNDAKFAGLLNQFVGVQGQITSDATTGLRYITPSDAKAVDVSKVNNGIVAAVSPPSLLPKAEASISGN